MTIRENCFCEAMSDKNVYWFIWIYQLNRTDYEFSCTALSSFSFIMNKVRKIGIHFK